MKRDDMSGKLTGTKTKTPTEERTEEDGQSAARSMTGRNRLQLGRSSGEARTDDDPLKFRVFLRNIRRL